MQIRHVAQGVALSDYLFTDTYTHLHTHLHTHPHTLTEQQQPQVFYRWPQHDIWKQYDVSGLHPSLDTPLSLTYQTHPPTHTYT